MFYSILSTSFELIFFKEKISHPLRWMLQLGLLLNAAQEDHGYDLLDLLIKVAENLVHRKVDLPRKFEEEHRQVHVLSNLFQFQSVQSVVKVLVHHLHHHRRRPKDIQTPQGTTGHRETLN